MIFTITGGGVKLIGYIQGKGSGLWVRIWPNIETVSIFIFFSVLSVLGYKQIALLLCPKCEIYWHGISCFSDQNF